MRYDPKIKFCGLKASADVETAIDVGADYIGLVFYAKSPRNVELSQAAHLSKLARSNLKSVALVVNATDEELKAISHHVAPDYFQLHGNEDAARMREIREIVKKPFIKAVGIQESKDIEVARQFPLEEDDIFLFDAKPPKEGTSLPGGNGLKFDWRLLENAQLPPTYMLAGGLTPDNIGEAVIKTKAPIFDVSSGIESEVGKKDLIKMFAFIQNAKNAANAVK